MSPIFGRLDMEIGPYRTRNLPRLGVKGNGTPAFDLYAGLGSAVVDMLRTRLVTMSDRGFTPRNAFKQQSPLALAGIPELRSIGSQTQPGLP